MSRKAAIYARVSTGKSAESDLSIPDQLRQAREYCEKRGSTVIAEYVDAGKLVVDRLADILLGPQRLRRLIEEAIEAAGAEQEDTPRQLEKL